MSDQKIFFDVGANSGEWGIEILNRYPNSICYGFEPTPELISIIKSKTQFIQNYVLEEVAISDKIGKTTFNISGQGDWGCSSLLEFKSQEEISSKWPGRWDIKKTETITVDVVTMEYIVEKYDIKEIEYFHCDTQGMDLTVLKSFGKYLNVIKSGVIETATSFESAIYSNQDNNVDSCTEWLINHNFSINRIESNDPAGNEVNIYFTRN